MIASSFSKCSNPRHEFRFGNVVGDWQLANGYWAETTKYGGVARMHLSFRTITIGKARLHSIILGRFAIHWGRIVPPV